MEENKPLISIVIPVYNREVLIRESIESALAQDYDNFEVVVVDNKSTDNTWEVVKSYEDNPHFRCYQNDINIGPVLNWKKGVELAKGEYVKILFSDDLIDSNFLSETVRLFDEETAFVLTPVDFFNKDGLIYTASYSQEEYSGQDYIDDFLFHDHWRFPKSPGCALFRKKDLEYALLDEPIPNPQHLNSLKNGSCNDLLIFLNTAVNYPLVKTTRKTKSYFRAHNGSFSIGTNASGLLDYNNAVIFFANKYIGGKRLNRAKTHFLINYLKKKLCHRASYEGDMYRNIKIGFTYYLTLPQNIAWFLCNRIHR